MHYLKIKHSLSLNKCQIINSIMIFAMNLIIFNTVIIHLQKAIQIHYSSAHLMQPIIQFHKLTSIKWITFIIIHSIMVIILIKFSIRQLHFMEMEIHPHVICIQDKFKQIEVFLILIMILYILYLMHMRIISILQHVFHYLMLMRFIYILDILQMFQMQIYQIL